MQVRSAVLAVLASVMLFIVSAAAWAGDKADEVRTVELLIDSVDLIERTVGVHVQWLERGKEPQPSKTTLRVVGGGKAFRGTVQVGQNYRVQIIDPLLGKIHQRKFFVRGRGVQIHLPVASHPDMQTIEGLQQDLADVRNQRNELKDAKIALENAYGELKGEKDKLQLEIDALTGGDRDAQETIARLSGELTTAQQQIASQQATIDGLRAQLDSSLPTTFAVAAPLWHPTYLWGVVNVELATFDVSAPVSEDGDCYSVTIDKDSSPAFKAQNVRVVVTTYDATGVGTDTQFGTSRPVVGDSEQAMTFSGYIRIPRSQQLSSRVRIKVYGEVLTSTAPGNYPSLFDLVGWNLVGTNTGSINFPGEVQGQNVIIVDSPMLTVSNGSASPTAKTVVMGSTKQLLFRGRISGGGYRTRSTDVVVHDTIIGGATGVSSIINGTIWVSGVQMAGPTQMVMNGGSHGSFTFNVPAGIVLSDYEGFDIEGYGDIATFASGGAVSGSVHQFTIDASDITARAEGTWTDKVTVVGSMQSGPITIGRTKLDLTANQLGGSFNRAPKMADDMGEIIAVVDPSYQAGYEDTVLTFQGAATPSSIAPFSVQYINKSSDTSVASVTARWDSTRGGWIATLSPNRVLTAGQTETYTVRVDSAGFQTGSLQVTIRTGGDVHYNDGTTRLQFDSKTTPITVFSGSYQEGVSN
jgi:hypothetical protein